MMPCMKTRISTCMFWATVLISLPTQGMPQACGPKSGVSFQVLTDHLDYAPGAALHVKFLVTNTGETPLYFSRHLNGCGSPVGFVSLQILDRNNQDVRDSGCSDDVGPIGDAELIEVVTDPRFWIQLQPREIFGGEATFALPAKKGTYRLKAELFPTSFTEKQKQILSKRGTRVLQSSCPAPSVTITVR